MEGSVKFGRGPCGPAVSRAMTHCACLGVAFDEIARRVQAGQSLDQVQAETGVGFLCSACVPDLRAQLAALAGDEDAA